MATIVNNPSGRTTQGNGAGFLLGVILLLIVAAVFLYFGLPYLNGTAGGTQINLPSNVNVPATK